MRSRPASCSRWRPRLPSPRNRRRPPAAEAEAEPRHSRRPACPQGLNWTFNFDASAGTFGFADSLYTDPKPEQPSGDLSDNWSEASVKPALSAEYTTASSSQIYGKFSAVGTRTFGAAPTLVGDDASSFDIEDAYIGWRSGNSLGELGENVLDFTVGRTQYKLGHGMLLCDGSAGRRFAGRLLDRCAQGLRVCRDRPLQARQSHASRRSISTRTTCRRPTPTASSGA